MIAEPYDSDSGRCQQAWTSKWSGQPLQCGRERGHVGKCRCAGHWRDESEAAQQSGEEPK